MGIICAWSSQVIATNIQAELLNCAKTSDSLQRLVCYDNVVHTMTEKVDVIESATLQESKELPKVAALPATPAPSSEILAERKPMDPEESFGAERQYIKKEQVDEVRFTVKSVTKTTRGKLKVSFENGQIWQQKDTDNFAKYVAGDIAIIKRGVFDSFYMKKPDANRTIRVKRIK